MSLLHCFHLNPSSYNRMSFITQSDFDPGEASYPDYQPKRFGLKYNPPTIILEYLVPSTGKLYHHKMRVRNLSANADEGQILTYIRHRHAIYLGTSKITDDQLLGLIRKLKSHMARDQPEVDYHTFDLNKLPPEEVKLHKDRMEKLFRQNSREPGEEGFQYDLRKDFQPMERSEWDEEEDF